MKCKGIIALGQNDPRMVEVDVPQPEEDQVQIRFRSSLVSVGTERARVLSLPNAETTFPFAPGYSNSGVVEKVGNKVTGFKPGDPVAAYAIDVGHREIGNVQDYNVVHIPDKVTFDEAAFTSLGQTSLQGVRKCRIELGEEVVSLGLGIVGLLALQLARLNGAVCTIGIDPVASRLEIAKNCGADVVINNSKDGWQEKLLNVTKGKGPAVVMDNTGVPAVMETACQIAADFARVCILGCPRGITDFNFYRDVQKKSITIIGAHAVDSIPRWFSYPNYWTFADDSDCFLRFVNRGDIKLTPMIDQVVDSKDAEEAYRQLLLEPNDKLSMIIHW